MKAPDHRAVLSARIARRIEVLDVRKLTILVLAAVFLIAFPAGIRPPTDPEGPVIGLATAMADDDDDDGGDDDDDDGGDDDDDDDGGDDSNDDDGSSDGDDAAGGDDDSGGGDDADAGGSDDDDDGGGGDDDDASGDDDDDSGSDREERGSQEDRGASSRGGGTRDVDRSATTPDSPAPIGRAFDRRDGEPGSAPTESGAARVRAMVEIARDLGAATPGPGERQPISGAVTQEMLDAAEQRYIDAVKDAWEAHGFPWTDSEVLGALDELDSLVSALESIMRDQDGGPVGSRVVTDINGDGFVDINDLWDAHRR